LRTHQAYPAAGDLPRGRPHTPRAVSITPFHYANMCSTGWVDPGIRRVPTGQGRCEPEGLHIKHVGDIPVTVKVTWTDGTEAEVNAWTSQWTHTTSTSSARRHPVSPVLGASLRRYAAVPGSDVDKFRKW
jgi:hypothetical protein